MSSDPMTAPVGPAQETSKTPEKAGEIRYSACAADKTSLVSVMKLLLDLATLIWVSGDATVP